MDFGLSAEQALLQETLRRFLRERLSTERVRAWIERRRTCERLSGGGEQRPEGAAPRPCDPKVRRGRTSAGSEALPEKRNDVRAFVGELTAQGVTGVLVPAEFGGSGLGLLDAAIVAEELGAAAAPISFANWCIQAPLAVALAGTQDQRETWLPRIASGEAVVCFVHDVPAHNGGVLDGALGLVPGAAAADALVLFPHGKSVPLLVETSTPGVEVTEQASLDETRPLAEVRLCNVRVDESMRMTGAYVATGVEAREAGAGAGDTPGAVDEPEADALRAEREKSKGQADTDVRHASGPGLRDRLLDAGRIVLAADALGAAERALEEAVRYSHERRQFGRPVGSFQAVKHMCAEAVAETEPLRALVWYAAFAWDEQREDAAEVAALAKAHAGEVATRVTTAAVQIFGGMGFTWECDVQLWFKRAAYDRQILGSPAEMRAHAADIFIG